MSETIKDKRIALKLEFSLRGKRKIPQVAFIGVGNFGVPMTAYKDRKQAAVFSKFSKAAHEFCKQMKDAGEFAEESK